MAVSQHKPVPLEVISLLSDTDDADDIADGTARFGEDTASDLASSPVQVTTPSAHWDWPADAGGKAAQALGEYHEVDGELVFIPNEDSDPGSSVVAQAGVPQAPPKTAPENVHTAEYCLKRILDIFPDVSHSHVYSLYNALERTDDYETLPGPARMQNILEQLVSAKSYPKEPRNDNKGKKRKRDDSPEAEGWRQWLRADRQSAPGFTQRFICGILGAEFSTAGFDHDYIHSIVMQERHLFQAYAELSKAQSCKYARNSRVHPHYTRAAEDMAAFCGWSAMSDELRAARRYVEHVREEQYLQDAMKVREEENLRFATEAGDTAECQACFDTLPMNRQIHCDGSSAHFTCFECAETYIKIQVGQSACKIVCTAGCGASFSPQQLSLLSNKDLLAKLAELEQQKAVRDAGLEGLEECSFCEYKAIMPPIDQDFLFECTNPDCGRVSCRRCRKEGHTPLSCEEASSENKLSGRHKIEEAMTAALVRTCNKCRKQFIKEYGCNKMTCSSCFNVQCYVCSQNVHGYDHFDAAGDPSSSRKCKLHDNVEESHAREVKEAESAARAQVLKDFPDISEQDLEIKMIEGTKQGHGMARVMDLQAWEELQNQMYQAELRRRRLRATEQLAADRFAMRLRNPALQYASLQGEEDQEPRQPLQVRADRPIFTPFQQELPAPRAPLRAPRPMGRLDGVHGPQALPAPRLQAGGFMPLEPQNYIDRAARGGPAPHGRMF